LRNQRNLHQSLQTPLATNPNIAAAIDPLNVVNKIGDTLNGSSSLADDITECLSPIEQEWIKELRQKIMEPVDTCISIGDLKRFSKHRKERTASSPSR
jgi:hypothetical protein